MINSAKSFGAQKTMRFAFIPEELVSSRREPLYVLTAHTKGRVEVDCSGMASLPSWRMLSNGTEGIETLFKKRKPGDLHATATLVRHL